MAEQLFSKPVVCGSNPVIVWNFIMSILTVDCYKDEKKYKRGWEWSIKKSKSSTIFWQVITFKLCSARVVLSFLQVMLLLLHAKPNFKGTILFCFDEDSSWILYFYNLWAYLVLQNFDQNGSNKFDWKVNLRWRLKLF